MSDDAMFLAAIEAASDDDKPRLMYANWLDEQGRPGGNFLRTECRLAAFDPNDDSRWELLNKLRVESQNIPGGWIASVSRVSMAEINPRVSEIQSLLQCQITVDFLLTRLAVLDTPQMPSRTIWARFRGLFQKTIPEPTPQSEGRVVRATRDWLKANLWPSDELWYYSTDIESWANLCGENGFAVVRKGKVIAFEIYAMN